MLRVSTHLHLPPLPARGTGNKWTRYEAELVADGNDSKGQLQLVADGKGQAAFDVVSLFPPTFRNRQNGLRPEPGRYAQRPSS